jgi:hypothetical protein
VWWWVLVVDEFVSGRIDSKPAVVSVGISGSLCGVPKMPNVVMSGGIDLQYRILDVLGCNGADALVVVDIAQRGNRVYTAISQSMYDLPSPFSAHDDIYSPS